MGNETVAAEAQRHHVGRGAGDRIGSPFVARGGERDRWRLAVDRKQGGNVLRSHEGNVRRNLDHAGHPFLREGASAQAAGGRVAALLVLQQDACAIACGESPRLRVAGDEQHPGQIRALGQRAQDVLRHGARQLRALLGGEDPGQPLFGVVQGLDRHDGPRP